MAGPGICVLCLADTCTSEVHPVFQSCLHLMDICFLTCICLWQISQIQTFLFKVVGPGLVCCLLYALFKPSSSVNFRFAPGPESSVLLSSSMGLSHKFHRWTGHWGELCNRTGGGTSCGSIPTVLDILKNHFASVAFL